MSTQRRAGQQRIELCKMCDKGNPWRVITLSHKPFNTLTTVKVE